MKKLDSIDLTSNEAIRKKISYGYQVAWYGVVTEADKTEELPPGAKVCPECGKPFWGRKGHPQYCSMECQQKAGKRRYMEKRKEKIGPEGRICPVCGKPIPEHRNLQAKTCSDECGNKLRNYKAYQRKKKKRMEEPVRKTCQICGNLFIPNRSNQKYCGKECAAVANRLSARKSAMMKKRLL